MENTVLNFIKRFTFSGSYEEVVHCFTHGCCYWFAYILFRRFLQDGAKLMYDEIDNHFGTLIGDKVYDITGDVTDKYDWSEWDQLRDASLRKRIVRDCIMF